MVERLYRAVAIPEVLALALVVLGLEERQFKLLLAELLMATMAATPLRQVSIKLPEEGAVVRAKREERGLRTTLGTAAMEFF